MSDPKLSALVLSFRRPRETRECLGSLRAHLKVPHKIVLLDNGGVPEYPWELYKEGLCDVLISKREGRGGGFGQTDLFRWCDTDLALFVQQDQSLIYDFTPEMLAQMSQLLDTNLYQCIDLNGDQSGRGVWTDRAHLIKTSFFNSLGPFPNGGPGNDALPWNEAHLQRVFRERGYRIGHFQPTLFRDNGKWSEREAGDGLYKHRTDLKQLWILKQPTYHTDVYPPFNDAEWAKVLAGQWVNGTIPEAWLPHSFRAWPDDPS